MNPAQTLATLRPAWSLEAVSEAVQRHYRDYPDHGAGCACLDPLIAIGAQLAQPADLGTSDRTREAVKHVLNEIARRL